MCHFMHVILYSGGKTLTSDFEGKFLAFLGFYVAYKVCLVNCQCYFYG